MSEVAADFYKKLVMVGDGGSGKTSMLSAYATGICPENVHATIFDTILTEVDVGSKKVTMPRKFCLGSVNPYATWRRPLAGAHARGDSWYLNHRTS